MASYNVYSDRWKLEAKNPMNLMIGSLITYHLYFPGKVPLLVLGYLSFKMGKFYR